MVAKYKRVVTYILYLLVLLRMSVNLEELSTCLHTNVVLLACYVWDLIESSPRDLFYVELRQIHFVHKNVILWARQFSLERILCKTTSFRISIKIICRNKSTFLNLNRYFFCLIYFITKTREKRTVFMGISTYIFLNTLWYLNEFYCHIINKSWDEAADCLQISRNIVHKFLENLIGCW